MRTTNLAASLTMEPNAATRSWYQDGVCDVAPVISMMSQKHYKHFKWIFNGDEMKP